MGGRGHIMHGRTGHAVLGFAVLVVLACGPRPNSGTGALEVMVHAVSSQPIAELRITLQAPGVLASPRSMTLAFGGDQALALVKDLPAGDHYAVTVQGHDQGGVVVAQGIAAAVAIRPGQTTKVIIYLHDLVEASPAANRGPLIDALALSSDTTQPGGVILLAGTAHDPDPGQTATLDFSWRTTAGCGALSGIDAVPGTDAFHPSASTALWTAPAIGGDCRITLTVKDALGLSSSVTVSLRALTAGATGNAEVSVVFNEPPAIVAISATPAQLSSVGPTSGELAAIVIDPENDALGFVWSTDPDAPCTVVFDAPTAASTAFVATPAGAEATYCTFLVTVDDGVWPDTTLRKNTVVAALILSITEPVVAQIAPIFGIGYQSYDVVVGGVTVMFGATVTDPAGGSLDYAWSASAGPAPEATSPPLLGLDASFTTAATWAVPDDLGNAGTGVVISVTATSSATRLSAAASFALADGSP